MSNQLVGCLNARPTHISSTRHSLVPNRSAVAFGSRRQRCSRMCVRAEAEADGSLEPEKLNLVRTTSSTARMLLLSSSPCMPDFFGRTLGLHCIKAKAHQRDTPMLLWLMVAPVCMVRLHGCHSCARSNKLKGSSVVEVGTLWLPLGQLCVEHIYIIPCIDRTTIMCQSRHEITINSWLLDS